jgi:toxin ParE1/3/4
LLYKIIIQKPARQDALEYAAFILRESKSREAANRWLDQLENTIRSLTEMPMRYKAIEEQSAFNLPLRQVLHHSHRVIYHVNEVTETVHILRVYHSARRSPSPKDINYP